MKKIFILFGFGILILSTGVFAKAVSLHCAKDSEFDLTDVNKNDSLHDYLIRLNLNEEGKGTVKFFRYQHYPLTGPSGTGQPFKIPGSRKHEWFTLQEKGAKGGPYYFWDMRYDFYVVYWALDRKTLELSNQSLWLGGYDYNKEQKAAFCRVVKEDEVDSLASQIVTFHKEHQERKAEKARQEAEEREADFTI